MPRDNGMGAAPNPQQNNSALRAALLATAPRMRKNLGTISAIPLGGSARQKLFNVGIITKLQLFVSASITIGTAVATPSNKAPWNMITRVRLTDYDGTDRINISGFQLFIINCVRNRVPYGFNNGSLTAVLSNPVVPTAVATNTISFFIDVPVAFDVDNDVPQLQDLRGAILAQTAVGEMYLTIDFNPSLYTNNDVESVYAGGGTTTVAFASGGYNVNTWQEYLLPQAIGGKGQVPIPGLDLLTVYELAGNMRSSDNLAVGTEKLISYPNVRTVIGSYFNYINNGAMAAGTDLSGFRLIANGNNILIDHTVNSQLFYQRRYMLEDADVLKGVYWRSHREKPIETALFGNVQMGITPSTVTAGNTYVEVMFESFYPKNAALPGFSQAQ